MTHFRQMTRKSIFELAPDQIPSMKARPQEPGSWDFQLRNGKLHQGLARLEGQWLTLDLELNREDLERRGVGPSRSWQTLLKQGLPFFTAKIVPNWKKETAVLRLETILPPEQDPRAQVAEALAILASSLEVMDKEDNSKGAKPFAEEQLVLLETILTEIHRPCTVDDQSRVSTNLISEREKSFRQRYRHTASISPSGKARVQVRVSLLEGLPLNPDPRQALGGILLEAGRRLRLGRGVAAQENGVASVALEVSHPWPISPQRLDLLLSVLGIAYQRNWDHDVWRAMGQIAKYTAVSRDSGMTQ